MSWNPNNHPDVDDHLWEELSGDSERFMHPWDAEEIGQVIEYFHEAGFTRGQKHAKEGRDFEVCWSHSTSKYVDENHHAVEHNMEYLVDAVNNFHEAIRKEVMEYCDPKEREDDEHVDALISELEDQIYHDYYTAYHHGYNDGMKHFSREVWNSLHEEAVNKNTEDSRDTVLMYQHALYDQKFEERLDEGLPPLCRALTMLDGGILFHNHYGRYYDPELRRWTF